MAVVRAKRLSAIEKRLLRSLATVRETSSTGSLAGRGTRRLEAVLHEAAFLRAFVAWERFLEETFLSYLMGQKSISGRSLHRYYQPPNASSAWNLLAMMSGRRPYLDWTEATEVAKRAKVVFRNGGWFVRLTAQNSILQDMKKLRNAISHDSDDARAKFEGLVRRELRTLPSGCTPGSFLGTPDRASPARASFLDKYLDVIEALAQDILRP